MVDRWVTEIVSGKKVYSGRKLGQFVYRFYTNSRHYSVVPGNGG
jgi:hypothetical protein